MYIPEEPSSAVSPEAKENELIALAYEQVEKRIRNGTATSQELVHFLKLGSKKSQIEVDNLRAQNDLLRAKTESLENERLSDERFNDVIKAMAKYQGVDGSDEELY